MNEFVGADFVQKEKDNAPGFHDWRHWLKVSREIEM